MCKDKGATMPIMESYPYAEDIAEFIGTRVNGIQQEGTLIWLGDNIQSCTKRLLLGCVNLLPQLDGKSCNLGTIF